MAINQNHLFDDLNGIKCAIVEKNVSKERTDFLRRMLEYNRFTVVIVPSPPPKAAPAPAPVPIPVATPASAQVETPASAAATNAPDPSAPAPAAQTLPAAPPSPPPPETFTIGVTDTSFNPTNAIFGRLLKAPGGHTVTLAYWQQKESTPDDEVPYFDARY
ncbi:MAG TPA: hypothetical protein VK563_11205 [Puia sp.]|nr:hypothetical protein [Puia sp.]